MPGTVVDLSGLNNETQYGSCWYSCKVGNQTEEIFLTVKNTGSVPCRIECFFMPFGPPKNRRIRMVRKGMLTGKWENIEFEVPPTDYDGWSFSVPVHSGAEKILFHIKTQDGTITVGATPKIYK